MGDHMKKMISMISAVLVTFALSSPITSIAKSAEFFTIGTGGPTGVYFQTGNAICKMSVSYTHLTLPTKRIV